MRPGADSFFQAEDGIRDIGVTGVQTCALPIFGEPDGLVKTIFDAKTGQLLGAHLIGAEVTELIQGFVIAMNLETTEEDLIHSVFPHPTLSEMMHESVMDAYGRVIRSEERRVGKEC